MEPLPDLSCVPDPAMAATADAESSPAGSAANDGWRDELSARLHRYRAKRKPAPPRYPSLTLPFDAAVSTDRLVTGESPDASIFGASDQEPQPYRSGADASSSTEPESESFRDAAQARIRQPATRMSAKVIEFPGFAWGPPSPPPDQLAEPVIDRPRILEVPEVVPPPPALGGITIEPAPAEPPEKQLGVDIPLRSARMGLRLAASVIDGLIIATASALFGFIFWKIAAIRPPNFQIYALAAGIPCLLWASYQYLLIVYAASTPGLRLAGLQLAQFDGTLPSRSLRRWRVLAAWLSAASLGMGYVWAFLDEDVLCWHDRITHTHLGPIRKK